MAWSIGRCLRQAGIPAAVMFVGFSIVDIAKHRASIQEAFVSNLLLFSVLWLGVSALAWVLTRIGRRHLRGQR